MHLSKKIKMFSQLFAAFLQSTFNLEQFGKKDEPHSLCISESIDDEKRRYVNA